MRDDGPAMPKTTGLALADGVDSISTVPSDSGTLPQDIATVIPAGLSMTLTFRNDRFVTSIAKAASCRAGQALGCPDDQASSAHDPSWQEFRP